MRSEAVASLRNWMKDRLGEQEEQLRAVERAVARMGELDEERAGVLDSFESALARLTASGLDETQIAGFVGADVAQLRASRGRASAATTRRNSTPDARTVSA